MVAIKYIVTQGADAQQAATNEAALGRLLAHPNVVQTFSSKTVSLDAAFYQQLGDMVATSQHSAAAACSTPLGYDDFSLPDGMQPNSLSSMQQSNNLPPPAPLEPPSEFATLPPALLPANGLQTPAAASSAAASAPAAAATADLVVAPTTAHPQPPAPSAGFLTRLQEAAAAGVVIAHADPLPSPSPLQPSQTFASQASRQSRCVADDGFDTSDNGGPGPQPASLIALQVGGCVWVGGWRGNNYFVDLII